MASPVEGVALAIINNIVVSALASSKLDGVSRCQVETCSIDIGKDLGFYTPLGHPWCYELSSYNHLIRLTSDQGQAKYIVHTMLCNQH